MDSLLNEAYVWVQVPELKPAASTSIWLYYGNPAAQAPEAAKETYTADSVLVYHFADAAKVGSDSSATGANAEGAPPPAAGALIGSGLRVFGQTPVKVNTLPEWGSRCSAHDFRVGETIRAAADACCDSLAVAMAPMLSYGLEQRRAVLSRSTSSAAALEPPYPPVPGTVISAAVHDAGTTTMYVNGKSYGQLAAAMPALKTPLEISKDSTGAGSHRLHRRTRSAPNRQNSPPRQFSSPSPR